MKKIFLLLSIPILFNSCHTDDNDATVIKMNINHHYQTGYGVGKILVLLTQEGDQISTNEWLYFYTGIEGFTYEPSYIYELTVATTTIANPLQDQSSIRYRLISLDSKEAVAPDTTFKIKLQQEGDRFINTTYGYSILNQIDINCNTLCTELDNRLQNDLNVTGIFLHGDNGTLELTGIE